MQLESLVVITIAAGISAGSMAILNTAPPHYLLSTFLCGMTGRLTRDLLMISGWRSGWATVLAATTVVLAATAILRRDVPPVVVIYGVLPLGATSSVFTAIVHLMRAANLKGDELSRASDALIADAGRVFTTSAGIAAGIGIGMMTIRAVRKEDVRQTEEEQ